MTELDRGEVKKPLFDTFIETSVAKFNSKESFLERSQESPYSRNNRNP